MLSSSSFQKENQTICLLNHSYNQAFHTAETKIVIAIWVQITERFLILFV